MFKIYKDVLIDIKNVEDAYIQKRFITGYDLSIFIRNGSVAIVNCGSKKEAMDLLEKLLNDLKELK